MPLGLERNELVGTWLKKIKSFGSSHGNVAHTSAKMQPWFAAIKEN